MNATTAAAPSAQPKKKKEAVPLDRYLTLAINASGKTNQQVAEEIGYSKGNVVAMMKTGAMKVPVNKVAPLAKSLGVDAIVLLSKVLAQTDATLWDTLESILGNRLVTENEMGLIKFLRHELHGVDVDLLSRPGFKEAVSPALAEIAKFESKEAERRIAEAAKADGRRRAA